MQKTITINLKRVTKAWKRQRLLRVQAPRRKLFSKMRIYRSHQDPVQFLSRIDRNLNNLGSFLSLLTNNHKTTPIHLTSKEWTQTNCVTWFNKLSRISSRFIRWRMNLFWDRAPRPLNHMTQIRRHRPCGTKKSNWDVSSSYSTDKFQSICIHRWYKTSTSEDRGSRPMDCIRIHSQCQALAVGSKTPLSMFKLHFWAS